MLMTMTIKAYTTDDQSIHQQQQSLHLGLLPDRSWQNKLSQSRNSGGLVATVNSLLDLPAKNGQVLPRQQQPQQQNTMGTRETPNMRQYDFEQHAEVTEVNQLKSTEAVSSPQHTVSRRATHATALRGDTKATKTWRKSSHSTGRSTKGHKKGRSTNAKHDRIGAVVQAVLDSTSSTQSRDFDRSSGAKYRPSRSSLPSSAMRTKRKPNIRRNPLAPGTEWRNVNIKVAHDRRWMPFKVIEAAQKLSIAGGCDQSKPPSQQCPVDGGCREAGKRENRGKGKRTAYMVTTPRNDGFGSIMLTLGWVMRKCINMEHVFVVNPHSFGNYDATGTVYHKLFERETACSEHLYAAVQPKAVMPGAMEIFYNTADDSMYGPPGELADKYEVSRGEWEGHVLRWLMRPNTFFIEQLQRTMVQIGYPARNANEAVIGIHIRRGDKVTAEHRSMVPAAQYIDAAVKLARAAKRANEMDHSQSEAVPVPSVIFVATDEKHYKQMFVQMRNQLRKDAGDLNLRLVSQADKHLHQHAMSKYLMALKTGFEYTTTDPENPKLLVKKASPHELLSVSHRATAEIASDVLLLAESDYFIGTAASSVAMAVVRLRAARYAEAGLEPPYRAVKMDAYFDQTAANMWTPTFGPSSSFNPFEFLKIPVNIP